MFLILFEICLRCYTFFKFRIIFVCNWNIAFKFTLVLYLSALTFVKELSYYSEINIFLNKFQWFWMKLSECSYLTWCMCLQYLTVSHVINMNHGFFFFDYFFDLSFIASRFQTKFLSYFQFPSNF